MFPGRRRPPGREEINRMRTNSGIQGRQEFDEEWAEDLGRNQHFYRSPYPSKGRKDLSEKVEGTRWRLLKHWALAHQC